MSKNSSDSYGKAQKGVLRMARVNCNRNSTVHMCHSQNKKQNSECGLHSESHF